MLFTLFKTKLKTSTPKNFLIFREMELSGSNINKILIFWKTGTLKKILYISGNGNGNGNRKWNFFLFQEKSETTKNLFIF